MDENEKKAFLSELAEFLLAALENADDTQHMTLLDVDFDDNSHDVMLTVSGTDDEKRVVRLKAELPPKTCAVKGCRGDIYISGPGVELCEGHFHIFNTSSFSGTAAEWLAERNL